LAGAADTADRALVGAATLVVAYGVYADHVSSPSINSIIWDSFLVVPTNTR
jgi:hypothetical protein